MTKSNNIQDMNYVRLIEQYREYKDQEDELKEKMEKIRGQAAVLLHEESINEKYIKLSDGERWKVGYQSSVRNVTDLKLLMEEVGPVKYDEIVTEKPSTFLTIRKSGKEKKEDLTKVKPNENNENSKIPSGLVLS